MLETVDNCLTTHNVNSCLEAHARALVAGLVHAAVVVHAVLLGAVVVNNNVSRNLGLVDLGLALESEGSRALAGGEVKASVRHGVVGAVGGLECGLLLVATNVRALAALLERASAGADGGEGILWASVASAEASPHGLFLVHRVNELAVELVARAREEGLEPDASVDGALDGAPPRHAPSLDNLS